VRCRTENDKYFTETDRLSHRLFDGWYNRGRIQAIEGDDVAAGKSFRIAVALEPDALFIKTTRRRRGFRGRVVMAWRLKGAGAVCTGAETGAPGACGGRFSRNILAENP